MQGLSDLCILKEREENMSKYVYPAVFTKEESGLYSIEFPDIPGCYTQGDDIVDGMAMAEDVLALMLYQYETDGTSIPAPSKIEDIKAPDKAFVTYISADTMHYRKKFDSKAVKKTLTIPAWMNEDATALGLNFSQILQEALAQKLGAK